jgi:hypothetical protein
VRKICSDHALLPSGAKGRRLNCHVVLCSVKMESAVGSTHSPTNPTPAFETRSIYINIGARHHMFATSWQHYSPYASIEPVRMKTAQMQPCN